MSDDALVLPLPRHGLFDCVEAASRDLEITIKVRVRVQGDDPATPIAGQCLLRLIESGGLDARGVHHIEGHYVSVDYANTYCVRGVPVSGEMLDWKMRYALG